MAKSDPTRVPQAPPEPAEYEENVMGRPARLPDPEDLEAGIELSDVDIGGVVRAGIALLAFVTVSFAIITALQWGLTGRISFALPDEGVADNPATVPYDIETRRETGVEYHRYRAYEDERLASYGWVDKASGVAHIPIERAMELMLARDAFPARPGSEGVLDEALGIPSDASSGRTLERSREWLDAESP